MARSPDTILLDVDGTLVDSTYLHALAWVRAFRSVDRRPGWASVHRAIGLGGDKLVAHVLDDAAEDRHGGALRRRWEEEYAALVDEVDPVPGANALIADIRRQGLKVALASSGAERFTARALEVLGISDEDVDAVTSAEDVDESKPEPDLLGVSLKRAGGTHGVLVGDTTWDIRAATKAGMDCIAVLTGGTCAAELRAAGAIEVVPSVGDLVGRSWSVAPTVAEP